MQRMEVGAAVTIGMAVGSSAPVEWDTVLDALGAAVPEACAAQVTGWDPVHRGYVVVAERGYRRSISDDLAHGLPRTRWGRQLFATDAPLLMDDMPQHFRASPHYQEWLRPAGMEDGLSFALRPDEDRVVGFLHMSAPMRKAFGEPAREFVTEVGPAIARAVDPLRCARLDAWLGPEWAANRITQRGEILRLSDRDASTLATDPRIVELAVRFGALAVESLLFLWRQGGRWFRVAMLNVSDTHRSGVVVASEPYANELGLTVREVDVATGLVAGLANQAIAERLVVSRRTVETYVERLLAKLDCVSRGEVAGVAARAGLVKPVPGPDNVGDLARLTRGAELLRH